jgi:hypothetical protein
MVYRRLLSSETFSLLPWRLRTHGAPTAYNNNTHLEWAERYLSTRSEKSCCRGSSSAKFPWRTSEFVLAIVRDGETSKHAYANLHLSLCLSLSYLLGGGQKWLHSVSSCGRFLLFFFILLGCDVPGRYFVSLSGRDLLTDRYWWCHSSVGLPSVITRRHT